MGSPAHCWSHRSWRWSAQLHHRFSAQHCSQSCFEPLTLHCFLSYFGLWASHCYQSCSELWTLHIWMYPFHHDCCDHLLHQQEPSWCQDLGHPLKSAGAGPHQPLPETGPLPLLQLLQRLRQLALSNFALPCHRLHSCIGQGPVVMRDVRSPGLWLAWNRGQDLHNK